MNLPRTILPESSTTFPTLDNNRDADATLRITTTFVQPLVDGPSNEDNLQTAACSSSTIQDWNYEQISLDDIFSQFEMTDLSWLQPGTGSFNHL